MSTFEDSPESFHDHTPTPGHPGDQDQGSGRHPVNVAQLVMAVAFAGLLTIWALFEFGVAGREDFRWLLPLPWLAAGAAGLLATGLPWRRT